MNTTSTVSADYGGHLLEEGEALIADGAHPATPGLYSNDYWASMTGQLIHIRRDARRIARSIARCLANKPVRL